MTTQHKIVRTQTVELTTTFRLDPKDGFVEEDRSIDLNTAEHARYRCPCGEAFSDKLEGMAHLHEKAREEDDEV